MASRNVWSESVVWVERASGLECASLLCEEEEEEGDGQDMFEELCLRIIT